MLPRSWLKSPPSHVWYGVTAENQEYWNKRVPLLQALPAARRFVSYEPALGPVDMEDMEGIDWVIIGGESTQGGAARLFDVGWARDAIIQCQDNGVNAFVKQLGSNAWHDGKKLKLHDKAGADFDEWPRSVQVRDVPPSKVGANIP